MDIELNNKTFVTFGLKGTGKSVYNRYLLSQFDKSLYYDTLGESSAINVPFDYYVPRDRYSAFELSTVVERITPAKNTNINSFIPRYDLFIIDEANRFCPPKPHPLPPAIADLNDQNRHYAMSVGYIARRPSQLNSDLTELAAYWFVFRLTGKNDIKYLNDQVNGLGDTVVNLKNFEFITVTPDRHYYVCNPIMDKDLTN